MKIIKILVDADACPVKVEIVEIAKKYKLEVIMLIDTSHIYNDEYSNVITVDKSNDSVDFAIINKAKKGDVVVTGDYGLASIVLSKGCNVINQNGFLYTDQNIDKMLFERHLKKKIIQAGGRSGYIKKRTTKDDEQFKQAFEKLVSSLV